MRKVNKTRLAEYIEAMSGLKVCLKFMATFFIIYIYIYKMSISIHAWVTVIHICICARAIHNNLQKAKRST